MRYVKWLIAALFAGWLISELVVNLGRLSEDLALTLGFLPWRPMAALVMPVWFALLMAFLLAFMVAVVLEAAAWYEYTRTIRLQRRQITALQDELAKRRESEGPSASP
jgi:hypothetical protein